MYLLIRSIEAWVGGEGGKEGTHFVRKGAHRPRKRDCAASWGAAKSRALLEADRVSVIVVHVRFLCRTLLYLATSKRRRIVPHKQ